MFHASTGVEAALAGFDPWWPILKIAVAYLIEESGTEPTRQPQWLTVAAGEKSGCGGMPMTASEYQNRAQECLDLAQTVPPKIRATLLDIAKAWLLLADDAMTREEPLDAEQNSPSTVKMQ